MNIFKQICYIFGFQIKQIVEKMVTQTEINLIKVKYRIQFNIMIFSYIYYFFNT